jgi:hypothetical protein
MYLNKYLLFSTLWPRFLSFQATPVALTKFLSLPSILWLIYSSCPHKTANIFTHTNARQVLLYDSWKLFLRREVRLVVLKTSQEILRWWKDGRISGFSYWETLLWSVLMTPQTDLNCVRGVVKLWKLTPCLHHKNFNVNGQDIKCCMWKNLYCARTITHGFSVNFYRLSILYSLFAPPSCTFKVYVRVTGI